MPPWIDDRALMMGQIILTTILAITVWVIHRVFPHLAGVRTIAVGFTVATVCRAVYEYASSYLGNPERFFLITTGDSLAIFATAIFCDGMQRFLGLKPFSRWVCVAIGSLCLAPMVGYPAGFPFQYLEVGYSALLAGLRLVLAAELYRHRAKPVLRLFAVFMLLYAAQALCYPLLRILDLPRGFGPSYSLHSINLILSVVFSTLLGIFLLAIIGDALLKEMERRSNTDSLTGYLNRRGFDQILALQFRHSAATGNIFSVAVVDLDYFKSINDTYGHSIGDEALILATRTLSAHLRSCDLLGRRGGDEFAILFPCSKGTEVCHLAQRICEVIAGTPIVPIAQRLSLSIGIAEYEQHDTADTLLARADIALYQAKNAGRGCARFLAIEPYRAPDDDSHIQTPSKRTGTAFLSEQAP